MTIELSVIIPTLDEAADLPRVLTALADQDGVALEVIVADGGSRDTTAALAREHGAHVVTSAAGRGHQMNAGAAQARGAWLLFLHADSRLTAANQLRRAIDALRADRGRHVAGHFPLRFIDSGDGHRMQYRYMAEKSASNRRYTVNGDQGLLLRHDYFHLLGGFDTAHGFLEDQRIAERIRRTGRLVVLPGTLETSARRFAVEGVRARYILMAIIMAMYAIDLRAFFAHAPDVYRSQSETGRLLLTPYFRLLRTLMREMGWRTSLHHWLGVGAFVLYESWQLFFVLDVAARPWLGAGRYPATAFHERVFAPLTHHRLGAWITAALVFAYSFGILAPVYRLLERRALRDGS